MIDPLPKHPSDLATPRLPGSTSALVQRVRELEQELADARAVIAAQGEVIARREATKR